MEFHNHRLKLMKLYKWFRMWSLGQQLDAQYMAQRMCREDLKDLALSIPQTEREFEAAKREYYGVMA